KEIDALISGDGYTSTEAMDNLTVLCDDFGSRFGGTEGEKQAADFMQAKLESYGLTNVHLEPFEYIGWRRGSAELEIISPIQKKIDCISLPHSPPTDITAQLYDAGDGNPATFEAIGSEMSGKIVMADSQTYPSGSKRWVHRSEKYGRSLLNGASAFIFMNHYPAYGPATGGIGHDGQGGLIAGLSVSYEDGTFLQRLLKKHGGVTLKIKTTDVNEPMTSWNVVGDLPGVENPETVVMLGCHYDGHDISQGAQDPASGAVAVIEAARLLSEHAGKLPFTLRFALWGVEEIGLLGSFDYAEKHSGDLDNLRFYLNMDGAGSIENKGIVLNEWPQIEALVKGWQEGIAYEFKTDQSINAHSDHYPFLLKGVPTGGMSRVPKRTGGRGYGHTRYDTLDKVNLRGLQDAAVLGALLAYRFASVPESEWPVERRSEAAVAELLDQPENAEQKNIMAKISDYYAEHA
ncbi:MAG: M28 family peptidase, partial [Chloroflexota bacterium]